MKTTTAVGSTCWAPAAKLLSAADQLIKFHVKDLPTLILKWDDALAPIGGDPVLRDWYRFAPLRLSREEDWSNWLAFLLETSRSGCLGAALTGETGARKFGVPHAVDREVSAGDYRTDLLIRWRDRSWCNVEVKLWDKNYRKTVDAAAAIQDRFGTAHNWSDVLLLPAIMVPDWLEVAAALPAPRTDFVHVATWSDVNVGLRRSFLEDREDVSWQAWATALCGAIEQRILGIPQFRRGRIPRLSAGHLGSLVAWMNNLRRALA